MTWHVWWQDSLTDWKQTRQNRKTHHWLYTYLYLHVHHLTSSWIFFMKMTWFCTKYIKATIHLQLYVVVVIKWAFFFCFCINFMILLSTSNIVQLYSILERIQISNLWFRFFFFACPYIKFFVHHIAKSSNSKLGLKFINGPTTRSYRSLVTWWDHY